MTPQLVPAITELASAFAEAGLRYAFVSGVAVGVRGRPLMTRDLDVAVSVANDGEAEAVVHQLQTRGYTVFTLVEQTGAERLATARLRGPRGVVVDVLFASSGLEPEVVARAEVVDVVPGVSAPVARAEELLATKVLSMAPRRPNDASDAQWLLEVGDVDLEVVRTNLELITDRGFNRGERLQEKLEGLLATMEG